MLAADLKYNHYNDNKYLAGKYIRPDDLYFERNSNMYTEPRESTNVLSNFGSPKVQIIWAYCQLYSEFVV